MQRRDEKPTKSVGEVARRSDRGRAGSVKARKGDVLELAGGSCAQTSGDHQTVQQDEILH